uniref:calcium-binding protein n=1 Tax=Parvularcula oceani TaxID=1247963 RepID=UPI00138E45E7
DANGDRYSNIEQVNGSDFADILIGGAGSELLFGDDGNDFLVGGAGADVINGGAGFDVLSFYNAGSGVRVDLGRGTGVGGEAEGDLLLNIEQVNGSAFNDILIGSEADNILFGDEGADFLNGRGGADILNGGGGVDKASYYNSLAAVNINLSSGLGSGGDAEGDLLNNIEQVDGSAFNDTLIGSGDADQLFGGEGADDLYGLGGADTLLGGRGSDDLDGGAGADVYLFRLADDAGGAEDNVLSFEQGLDLIDLSEFGYSSVSDLTLQDVAGAARIVLDNSVIDIEGVAASALSDADFIFA